MPTPAPRSDALIQANAAPRCPNCHRPLQQAVRQQLAVSTSQNQGNSSSSSSGGFLFSKSSRSESTTVTTSATYSVAQYHHDVTCEHCGYCVRAGEQPVPGQLPTSGRRVVELADGDDDDGGSATGGIPAEAALLMCLPCTTGIQALTAINRDPGAVTCVECGGRVSRVVDAEVQVATSAAVTSI